MYLTINIFTLSNLFIFFLFLFVRKDNSWSNRVLGLILLCPALNFFNNALILTGVISKLPFFIFIFQGTAIFYGTLVEAYVILLIGRKYKWMTVLNFFALGILMLDVYFGFEFYLKMDLAGQQQYISDLLTENYPWQMQAINILCLLLWISYFVKSIVMTVRHEKIANEYFSDTEKIKIRFLKRFIYLLTSLTLLLIFLYGSSPTPVVEYFVIPIIVNIVYLYVIYFAFRESAIFTRTEYCELVEVISRMENFQASREPLCKEIEELKKGKKYKLTEAEIEVNYQKLISYFKEHKPYLQSDINLTKLANALNACSHNISLTINLKFEMNFFSLINSYRVQEAQEMLKMMDSNNFTIEGIAKEVGFNSKSSFYSAFKKHSKYTPSEFLERSSVN